MRNVLSRDKTNNPYKTNEISANGIFAIAQERKAQQEETGQSFLRK
jgi:hypothetical protein